MATECPQTSITCRQRATRVAEQHVSLSPRPKGEQIRISLRIAIRVSAFQSLSYFLFSLCWAVLNARRRTDVRVG
jgi:hypothetical protein